MSLRFNCLKWLVFGTIIAIIIMKNLKAENMSKILLIENEEFLRKLYSEFLSMSKYQVETAENGKDGFAKLDSFMPELIILDIKMPVMDGPEFLRIIKKNMKLRDIPVIILTGVSEYVYIKECLELGANDYVEKTTHPVDLLKKVEHLLSDDIEPEIKTASAPTEIRYDVEKI